MKPNQIISMASLVAQTVKRLPTMRETWVQSLGQEVPLEKETATHSSILAWKIPWTEEPSRLQSMGSQGRQLHGKVIPHCGKSSFPVIEVSVWFHSTGKE